MEHINPYAVMRSTATLEAYKARQKGLVRAAQPFAGVAILCGLAGWPMIALPMIERWVFQHLGPVGLLIPAGLILVGTASLAMGLLGMRRYQRENPIPDEWRQIPRIRPFGR